MTRIAIVEDEAAVREQLAGYVQRYTRRCMYLSGCRYFYLHHTLYNIIMCIGLQR